VLARDVVEPTIWTVRNEVRTVNRPRRRLEKGCTRSRRVLLRSRAVWVCVAAAAGAESGPLRRDRAGTGAAQAG